MDDAANDTIPSLLAELRAGNRDAVDRLLPLVYAELHEVAGRQRRGWRAYDSLNTTALVHEVYLRLAGASTMAFEDRPHFLRVAARAMRQILLDNAKRRHATKRGGGTRALPLHKIEAALSGNADSMDAEADALVALDEALHRLHAHDARQTGIVECRFFGGMTIEDTAAALGISPATVKRGWTMAQAWLYRELARSGEDKA
jgi:RNA polymerase sigma factor (TIGR02999 family)